eukprot:scaffold1525_cov142-Cylindrotheca_fusiformis.AAC.107
MRGAGTWIRSSEENGNRKPFRQDRRSGSTSSRLSVSTGAGSREPRIVGWKGETLETFRPSSVDVTEQDVPSPLDSTNSFRSGKSFWMRFLRDNDAPSFSSSTESEKTASLYPEIKRTGTSVSSLTEYSGFKRISAPSELTIPRDPYNSGSVYSPDERPVSVRSDGREKRRSPVAYPPGTLPIKSPRLGEGLKQASFESPKAPLKVITPQHNPAVIEPDRSPSTSNGKEVNDLNDVGLLKTSPKSVQQERFENAYRVWLRAGLMKNGEHSRIKARSPTSDNKSYFSKKTHGEPATISPATGQVMMEFRDAETMNPYEVWRRVGLMKNGAQSTSPLFFKRRTNMPSRAKGSIPEPAVQKKQKNPSELRDDSALEINHHATRVKQRTSEKKNPYHAWRRAGLMKTAPSSITSPPQVPKQQTNVPTETHSIQVSSSESPAETSGIVDDFQDVLKQWKDKNDGTQSSPNPSPVHQKRRSLASRQRSSTDSNASDVEKENQNTASRPSLSCLNEDTNIDFFDQMRERLSPRESQVGSNPSQIYMNDAAQVSPVTESELNQIHSSRSSYETKNPTPATERFFKETLHSRRNTICPQNAEPSNRLSIHSKREPGQLASLEGNRAIILLENDNKYEVLVGQAQRSSNQELLLHNVELVSAEKTMEDGDIFVQGKTTCECSQSIFSGNDDLINFFLPQMGMACTCKKQQWGFAKPEDPTAIENVLRPWQVEFLHRFGIVHADQLVKARHRSSAILAKAMRQWRMKEKMLPFRTSSCLMALDIWAKTCKAYVRSVRKQLGSEGASLANNLPEALVPELTSYLSEISKAQGNPNSRNTHGAVNV